eukprot:16449135-Heterocapsa_arctica.AAC.1
MVYNAAISACEKGCAPEQALALLQDMRRRGLRPSAVSYNAAISACEKGHLAEEPEALLKE